MSNGIFGNMFDFNGDGDLDIFEQATEFDFLQKMMEDDEKSDSHEDDDSDDGALNCISPRTILDFAYVSVSSSIARVIPT